MEGGPSSSLVGRELGSYQVVRELGEGGMGVVFEAEHRLLGRRVAIKTIRPDAVADASFSRRFMLEARAICALNHPGIVRLYDFAFEGEMPYIVMEHVHGKTLQEVIEGGRTLEPSSVVELLRPVADALDHAHANGVVHRDVKPGNLLLAYDGRTMIMDFGLAHLAGYTLATDPDSVLGTPDYIAPEQVAGEDVDGRADIYSLASVVFEAVTGQPPFAGGTWIEVASRRLTDPAPLACEIAPSVPREFALRLARGLDREPARRPPTAVSFFEQLADAFAEAVPAAVTEPAAVFPVHQTRRLVANPALPARLWWPVPAAVVAATVITVTVVGALGLGAADHALVKAAMHAARSLGGF